MNNSLSANDLNKEVFTVISLFEDDLIKRIPNKVLNNIIELASSSEKSVKLDMKKSLAEQDISEECKDYISLIYYSYLIDDENEKNEILKKWQKNEEEHQKELKKIYNANNLFKTNNNNDTDLIPIVIERKEHFIIRIINKIKKKLGL